MKRNREARHRQLRYFSPLYGYYSSGQRLQAHDPETGKEVWIPSDMPHVPFGRDRHTYIRSWKHTRHMCDFEYWLGTRVILRNHHNGLESPFIPSTGQLRVIDILEDYRRQGRSIDFALLRCQPWGGLTIIHLYSTWIRTSGAGKVTFSMSSYEIPVYVGFEIESTPEYNHILWHPALRDITPLPKAKTETAPDIGIEPGPSHQPPTLFADTLSGQISFYCWSASHVSYNPAPAASCRGHPYRSSTTVIHPPLTSFCKIPC